MSWDVTKPVVALLTGGLAIVGLLGTDEGAFHALQTLPHVALVEYDGIVRAGEAQPPQRELGAALPVKRSLVTTGDGAIELQPGQTVTARYQQPDGSVLTASLHM